MSGFSSCAVEWAHDRLESCMMLFFGSQDIEDLMRGASASPTCWRLSSTQPLRGAGSPSTIRTDQ